MYTARTPAKKKDSGETPPKAGNSRVRRSIGEWESAGTDKTFILSETSTQTCLAKASKNSPVTKEIEEVVHDVNAETRSSPKKQYKSRTFEARACLNKAKLHLSNSRNLRTDIKQGVTEAIDRLYQIVKELEEEQRGSKSGTKEEAMKNGNSEKKGKEEEKIMVSPSLIQEHTKLLLESNKRMQELKDVIEKQKDSLENIVPMTYANVTASKKGKTDRNTLHSVVVTSTDEMHTGEEVLEKVRQVVDAKEGWVKVERVRKAKDQKIILGFETEEERKKIKERLEKEGHLTVEEVKNKDPLLILKDVLKVNNDQDVLKALRNQNRNVFRGLDDEEQRIMIKYRKKARNPHACHIVISISPIVWGRLIDEGSAHIDLQRIRVYDQSPLVQCTRCLAYGHSKRFCGESADLCSHCGGPHLRSECADQEAGTAATCINCKRAKLENIKHNAFSSDCPIRRKWDEIAKSTVAYC